MRELQWMADARGRMEWNQTSQVLAMLYNSHKDSKGKSKTADDFNPYSMKAVAKPMLVPMSAILPMIMGSK